MGFELIFLCGLILALVSLIFSCVWNIVYVITLLTVSCLGVIICGAVLTMIGIPITVQLLTNYEQFIFAFTIGGVLFTIGSIMNCVQSSKQEQREISCTPYTPYTPCAQSYFYRNMFVFLVIYLALVMNYCAIRFIV
jgi:hypothetical protein